MLAEAGAAIVSGSQAHNVVGGVLWVAICLFAGYFFGNLPFVKRNFSLVILAIVVVSILPAVVEYLRHRRNAKTGHRLGSGLTAGSTGARMRAARWNR